MSEKDEKPEELSLRIELSGEHARMLHSIMEDRKFKYYSEAIRYCILEASQETEFKLEEGYWAKIKELLDYDFVKLNYRIYNVPDFINNALESYIREIEKDVRSILSFEVRQQLEGKELDVALAFIECQEQSYSDQVTIDRLASQMNKRNTSELKNMLDDFVTRGLLSKKLHDGKYYYHAKRPELYD